MTAVTGEIGEAANIVKKLNRYRDGIPGNDSRTESLEQLRQNLAYELADAVIYLDLMIQALGLDPETIREEKFQITSKKRGYKEEE
jgi:NTP pyrophosphatase (non-canonical NTP hydrolase)